MPKPSRQAPRLPRVVTPDLVRDALSFIPPDVDRDTWARVGMAIKSELADERGFELWEEWSARGSSYSAKSARETWRSIKAGGRTTVGTLFGIAKDHGFSFPMEQGERSVEQLAQAEASAAAAAQKRRQQQATEAAEYRRRADRAAREAAKLWAEGDSSALSPYLQRKGVRAFGVRVLTDGTLLVPMVDGDGQLQNLQRIAPRPPSDGGTEKRFLPGGRKSGLWHRIGEAGSVPVLLLAEGYATAATVHQATGRPVVVCFDAGNLVHVAKALRAGDPTLPLLVCADDDAETEARTGKNPGREKARSAARAAGAADGLAAVVVPRGLPPGGTDFNDLGTYAGMPAVAELVEAAVHSLLGGSSDQTAQLATAECASAPPAAGASGAPPRLRVVPGGKDASPPRQNRPEGSRGGGAGGDGSGDGSGGGGGGGHRLGAAAGDGGGDGPSSRDPFTVDDRGVWFTARDPEGNDKRPVWVCARLLVTARTRADDLNGWGFLLEFADPDGNPKTWAMPSAMLSGEGGEWAARLRDMGLQIAPGTRSRNLLAQYIDTRRTDERVTCVDRVGWHGAVYVLPSACITPPNSEGRQYVFQSESGVEDTFRQRGGLADWQAHVARLAQGNSRLVFALCCAFAGPTVRPAGIESGGFHFRGESSVGKTTALKVAASVWGRPAFMQRWRTTDNALEAIAAQHCDCTLILDEFGQLDPRVAGDVAYMLANEQEKGRATRGALLRRRRTWRLIFLSSGEVSLADHMAEGGKRSRAGMEVRMLDVPLDAGFGMGGIEDVHDQEGPGALADAIVSAAARCYGTAGRAWVEWCCEHHAELPELLQGLIERNRDQMLPAAAAEQVRRAASRFALVAAAGELATAAGITGWPEGHAQWAVRQCFNAWLGARGHLDNGEEAAMLRQVRHFIELNGEGRFTQWERAFDDHAPRTLNRAGFRRLVRDPPAVDVADDDSSRVEYFILREVFDREVCRGYEPKAVARLLRRRGHLIGEKAGGETRLLDRQKLPGLGGVKVPCYHIAPSIFADDL